MRHGARSQFIVQGWTLKKIQTLLGHTSITMTRDVYAHLSKNAEEGVSMFKKLQRDLLSDSPIAGQDLAKFELLSTPAGWLRTG